MRIKLRFLAILATFALLLVPATALAQPAIPLLFSGDVTIGGVDAPIGTTVSAEIEDVEVASVTTTVVGQYFIDVPRDNNIGKTVVFKVNGVVGGNHEYVDPWETPIVTLNLAAGVPPPTYYTLTVNVSPLGSGTVTKSPNLAQYPAGTSVTLTATAAADYSFSSWSGTNNNAINPTTVTMTSNKSVTAHFTSVVPGEYPSFTDWWDWWTG